MRPTNDVNVRDTQLLRTPNEVKALLPISPETAEVVFRSREEIRAVLRGRDDRLLVVVGPCSVHDPEAAIDYARRLEALRRRVADDLLVVMRVYFEKPRTTVGWKGLINDPHLNGSHEIGEGLEIARRLLLRVAEVGLPAATEVLDPIVPQYLADLGLVGRHRRAHDREPDAPRDGERPVDARRLQERHRRRPHGRHPRDARGVAAPQFPGHRR